MNRNNEAACCRPEQPYDREELHTYPCDTPCEPCEPGVLSTPKKAYSINIEQLDFGYIVRVGCQTFAVESASKVITNLEAYLNDPKGIEKQWYANKTLNFKVTT